MRLKHDGAIATDWILKNAFIESFTIHARTLAQFLYKRPNPQFPNDVTAEHYVKDVSAWRAARGTVPPELQDVIDRTGKEIAHLTTGRALLAIRGRAGPPSTSSGCSSARSTSS